MPGMLAPSSGCKPIIWILGFFDFRYRETPIIVPVVPIELTKWVIFLPLCSQISGPVFSKCAKGLSEFPNWSKTLPRPSVSIDLARSLAPSILDSFDTNIKSAP